MSGLNDFAPFYSVNTSFVVLNITDPPKMVAIFNYPIAPGDERDLLKIPGVSESDIRASLLKGQLRSKLLSEEITITNSDIDLLQFNTEQKNFLISYGVNVGYQVSGTQYMRRDDKTLVGTPDGLKTTFKTQEIFVFNSNYTIIVYKNGVKQSMINDYFIAEPGGPGTGYQSVIFDVAPLSDDLLTADYYVST